MPKRSIPQKGVREMSIDEIKSLLSDIPKWIQDRLNELGLRTGHSIPVDDLTQQVWDGVLPSDMHLKSYEEIMKYLNWYASLRNCLIEQELVYRQAAANEKYLVGKLKRILGKYAPGENSEAREADVELDRDLITFDHQRICYERVHEFLKAGLDKAEVGYSTCSRILSGRDRSEQQAAKFHQAAVGGSPPTPWRESNEQPQAGPPPIQNPQGGGRVPSGFGGSGVGT